MWWRGGGTPRPTSAVGSARIKCLIFLETFSDALRKQILSDALIENKCYSGVKFEVTF